MLEIERTENYINSLKENINKGKQLERLEANEDFRSLIMNDYCKDHLVKLFYFVEVKSSNEIDDAIAISKYKRSMLSKKLLKQQAELELPEQENYLIELKKENK